MFDCAVGFGDEIDGCVGVSIVSDGKKGWVGVGKCAYSSSLSPRSQ